MAALARVERTDFLSPMCIGEVANVSAEITYTSRHSVEVQVNVMSENILTGGWLLVAVFQNTRNNSVKPRACSSDPIICSITGSMRQRGDLVCLLTELGVEGGLVLGRWAKQAPWDLWLHCSEKQQNLFVALLPDLLPVAAFGLKKSLFLLLL